MKPGDSSSGRFLGKLCCDGENRRGSGVRRERARAVGVCGLDAGRGMDQRQTDRQTHMVGERREGQEQ